MRFIYNTTFSIDENIAEEFIQVVQGGYIAYLKSKNLCNDILFTRVMIREGEGLSLSLQLIFPSAEEYTIFIEVYIATHAGRCVRREPLIFQHDTRRNRIN